MFTLALLDFLQTPPAQAVLAQLHAAALTEQNHLAWAARLRKTFSPEQASVLLETARLRRRAVTKFGEAAAQMVFTADALEQASHVSVVTHCRQARFSQVLDLCCGIGTDSLGFARQPATVEGVDLDAVRVAMARLNSAALGLPATFTVGDATAARGFDGTIFFDPARRDDGKRIYHVEQYQPPLSTLRQWQAPEIIVKLSPGVDLSELEAYPGRVSFISVNGDLKEALLTLAADETPQREALVIGGDTLHRYQSAGAFDPSPITPPLAWFLEPDPAIIRAGLVRDLALTVGAQQMDPQIAYLTSEQPIVHPALRQWRILDWMPFHVKKLRAYLRERHIGTVTVKKRASPLTPEALLAQLKPQGSNACVVVLTRYRNDPIMVVCAER